MNYTDKDIFDTKIRKIVDALINHDTKTGLNALNNAKQFFNRTSNHDTDTFERINDILDIDLGLDVKDNDLSDAQGCVHDIDEILNVNTHVL